MARYKVDVQPVLSALAAVGLKVEDVADVVPREDYRKAVPVLVGLLPQVQSADVKESVVRALSMPAAKEAARPLLEEFRQIPTDGAPSLKWAIGNGLEVLAGNLTFDDVAPLVRDRTHGKAREMVVLGLAKVKDPRVVALLVELLEDEPMVAHAIMALRKIGASSARPSVERFLQDPRSLVRSEAKKAIAKFDKAAQKLNS